jgi:hypothetical protein
MTDRNYIDMLTYMRPEGSKYQRKFCNRYLMPVFGQPDKHGNYTHIVGDKPRIAFMAHHDTVHSKTGRQTVTIDGDYAKATTDCLGADCTSGIYIMLCMIEAGIEGVYVVHAAEEVGCVGSKGLVSDFPAWIDHVDAAISFDRKGYDSIITHQMGLRSCSYTDLKPSMLLDNRRMHKYLSRLFQPTHWAREPRPCFSRNLN